MPCSTSAKMCVANFRLPSCSVLAVGLRYLIGMMLIRLETILSKSHYIPSSSSDAPAFANWILMHGPLAGKWYMILARWSPPYVGGLGQSVTQGQRERFEMSNSGKWMVILFQCIQKLDGKVVRELEPPISNSRSSFNDLSMSKDLNYIRTDRSLSLLSIGILFLNM